MMTHPARPRQFSLRALLLAVLALAVLLGAWRAFGAAIVLGVLFVMLSALPFVIQAAWKRAYLAAWLAVYGPFVGMASYTLGYVSCSHCKAAAWWLLPYGPGLFPLELVRSWLDLPRPGDPLVFVIALLVCALLVAALTGLLRILVFWWRLLAMGIVLTLGTFSALALLALIRA
jgi:hypothetical protein